MRKSINTSYNKRQSGASIHPSLQRGANFQSQRIGDINKRVKYRKNDSAKFVEAPGRKVPRQQQQRARTSQGTAQKDRLGKAKEQRANYRLPAVIILALLVVALIVSGLYAFARLNNMFPIKNVSVQGVEHLTSTEVSALAQVPENTSMFDIDYDGIRQRLMLDAWIQNATVSFQPPDTLSILVNERQIGAVVEINSADSSKVKNWALSTDGIWLMPIPDKDSEAGKSTSAKIYEDAEKAVHIVDVPYSTSPKIGESCSDENVNNAISILSGMTTELADQVIKVSAADTESTKLTLESGVEIAFGSATDIRSKERVCLEILREHEGKISFINVRTVNRPTWRSME